MYTFSGCMWTYGEEEKFDFQQKWISYFYGLPGNVSSLFILFVVQPQ